MGIKQTLDSPHEIEFKRGLVERENVSLELSDSMLGGNGAFKAMDEIMNKPVHFPCSGDECIVLSSDRARKVVMQIAIADMAEDRRRHRRPIELGAGLEEPAVAFPHHRVMVAADDGSFEMTGLPPPPYRVVVTHEELARVTAADVRAAAQAVFRADRMSVVAVGLLSESEERKLEKLVKAF